MSDGRSRRALFDQLAQVGKALGNGTRLALIELLAQGPRGVVELAQAAGLNVTTTSAHLQTLKHAGLVATDRAGTTIRYRIADDDVAALYGQLLDVAAAHLAEVNAAARRYLGPDDTEQIGREELLQRSAPVKPSSSTFGLHWSTRPGTSPVQCRFRWTNLPSVSRNCPLISKSSPTAEGSTACSPTRLSGC